MYRHRERRKPPRRAAPWSLVGGVRTGPEALPYRWAVPRDKAPARQRQQVPAPPGRVATKPSEAHTGGRAKPTCLAKLSGGRPHQLGRSQTLACRTLSADPVVRSPPWARLLVLFSEIGIGIAAVQNPVFGVCLLVPPVLLFVAMCFVAPFRQRDEARERLRAGERLDSEELPPSSVPYGLALEGVGIVRRQDEHPEFPGRQTYYQVTVVLRNAHPTMTIECDVDKYRVVVYDRTAAKEPYFPRALVPPGAKKELPYPEIGPFRSTGDYYGRIELTLMYRHPEELALRKSVKYIDLELSPVRGLKYEVQEETERDTSWSQEI